MIIVLIFICSLLVCPAIHGQDRVAFYNVENLFHPSDDSTTNDGAFTPSGSYHHTNKKYSEKLTNVSKAIISISDQPLLFLGLCEVENRTVLFDLLNETALSLEPYRFIHQESPDGRGIDVALIYNTDRFTPIKEEFYTIPYRGEPLESREVVYAYGLVNGAIPIHIFVNHWPSKYGGAAASEPKRLAASHLLDSLTRDILKAEPKAIIIALGDFNAQRSELPVRQLITEQGGPYHVLPLNWPEGGTHKFRGHWSAIDHVLVSDEVYFKYLTDTIQSIHHPPFLLEDETSFPGQRPFRFYLGPKYHGGYSDHLPVYIDLQF